MLARKVEDRIDYCVRGVRSTPDGDRKEAVGFVWGTFPRSSLRIGKSIGKRRSYSFDTVATAALG